MQVLDEKRLDRSLPGPLGPPDYRKEGGGKRAAAAMVTILTIMMMMIRIRI